MRRLGAIVALAVLSSIPEGACACGAVGIGTWAVLSGIPEG